MNVIRGENGLCTVTSGIGENAHLLQPLVLVTLVRMMTTKKGPKSLEPLHIVNTYLDTIFLVQNSLNFSKIVILHPKIA